MPTESPTSTELISQIEDRCDAIEECYEFMLAYAGKGIPSDEGGQARSHLEKAARALTGLANSFAEIVEKQRLQPAERYQAFLSVLDRDVRDSLAAVELVLAQSKISSQLIDNLNASIHLRALLTDLFLIDGILRDQEIPNSAATG